MIPHRTLGSEICGNGLKGRVTACRKRLRINRAAKRTQVDTDTEELFAETTPSVSRVHGYDAFNLPGFPSPPASVVLMDYRFGRTQPAESETLQLVGEQEVGIE